MNIRKISVKEFKKRRLERSYISVYIVIKPITIENEAEIELKNLCVIYGFTALGFRRVIAIYFENTKDNRFWLGVFEDLRARNIKNIMFLVTPQNRNIERCAKIIYNDIEIIRSQEDIMGTIDKYFATKTSRTLEIQLKNLILAEDIERCEENIEIFKQQYLHNQLVLEVFKRQEEDIKKLYKYNYDIRKLLYQCYAIREIKRHINRLNERQPLQENIDDVIEHFIEYISSLERGLTYSKKGWVKLMNILYEIYPKAKTQRCIVHIVRNIYGILDKKKSKETIGNLKKIYTASNGNNTKLEYENFIEKYKSNEKLIRKLNSVIEHIFNIFEYPAEIRKIIYTTNPIESLNSSLRKVTRGKGLFISKEALLKVLYLRIKDLEKSWSKETKNWENVKHQLIELYGERVLKYYFNT